MDNRAGEMQVFVETAQQGSFSEAGRRLKLSPSAVSKLVSRIEDRLGTTLLVRTTRALRLTPEGEAYVERARRILADIDEAERMVAGGEESAPRGRLRVSASVGFGTLCIVPVLPKFLELHPDIELDLSLTDTTIDLLEERTDVAIRSGTLRDSSLKARKLLESRRVVAASPAYLERHGRPEHPKDLVHHNCLTFNFRPEAERWPFKRGERSFSVPVSGNFQVNNGPTMRQLCRDGVGLVRMGQFFLDADIRAGRLVPVLEDFNPNDIELIHAVYAGHQHLAARIRAFVDFLVNRNAFRQTA
jgi:DNA-binding transcriptional LysR family regulator